MPMQAQLLRLIAESVGGLTVDRLFRSLRETFPALVRRDFREMLQQLVTDGRLHYRQHHGVTRIALGGYRPAKISERIYLMAAPMSARIPPGSAGVRLAEGTAFGAGDHPTTCLMLRALDPAIIGRGAPGKRAQILDVGTGNGVLAIAALLLGAERVVGLDIDPQACHEARHNARLNEVAERFLVVAGSVETMASGCYDLLLANLRPPTLARLLPRFGALLAPTGLLMLSGFRCAERTGVEKGLPSGFQVVQADQDRDWAMLVARRGAPLFGSILGGP